MHVHVEKNECDDVEDSARLRSLKVGPVASWAPFVSVKVTSLLV